MMTLNELLTVLTQIPSTAIQLKLPSGEFVPSHFHVTEVGRVQKDFIDCGGTIRSATTCVLQVWVANDVDHRLETSKLAQILQLATPLLKTDDLPVEVEYETTAISQYPLASAEVTPSALILHLQKKQTACLAEDRCGIGPADSDCCSIPDCCDVELKLL